MTTLTSSSLKINQKRSSSCSNFALRVLNNASPSRSPYYQDSPHHKINCLQNSFDLDDSLESPALSQKRSILDYCTSKPSRFHSRSTRPSTIKLSPKTAFEDYVATPELTVDLELLVQDDEEITPKELPTPKESDFEISVNMVINEIIASANACVSYPCHVSIKPKEEYTPEKLSVDLSIILDIKHCGVSSIMNTLQDFLTKLNENDRLALFCTQKGNTKRFPLRIMHQDAKNEFLEELGVLSQTPSIPGQELSLSQVLRATVKSVRDRKYRNHISAIFLLTDSMEECDFFHMIKKETQENFEENPLIFAFGLGQKHNTIGLQEVCEAFEGRYCHVETPESLCQAMESCLLELSYIRLKNVRMSFEVECKDIDDDTLRIARLYEKKTLVEESSGFVEAHANHFSMKEGIDIALELEVSKCRTMTNEQMMPYHLTVCFSGDSVSQDSEVCMRQDKELSISKMHPMLRMMPKKIDKKALESFYRIKVAKIVSYAVKMAGDGYLKQSLQSLNNVKKELYTFTMLRSEAIQKMMKTIDCTVNNLQTPSFRTKEKLNAFKGLNLNYSMVGI